MLERRRLRVKQDVIKVGRDTWMLFSLRMLYEKSPGWPRMPDEGGLK
jgi:hypothetical protein